MDKTLLLREQDLVKLNNISANVDIDKLTPFIYMAQNNKIVRMLKNQLYNKILTDFEGDELSGDYLTLYNDYVVDALIYYTTYFYWTVGLYQVDNQGAYKKSVENSEFLDPSELLRVGKFFEQQGQSVELNFETWIKDKNIPEYNNGCSNNDNNSRGLNWQL